MPQLASYKECTACMACIDTCNHKAIDYRIDKYGYYKMVIDTGKCVNCGLCEKKCPVLNKPVTTNCCSQPYAGWCSDTPLRSLSASGGIFATIAKTILENKGVVYGAAIDGFEVKHIRIENKTDLHKIQGTKYQQSITKDIYKRVKKDLQSDRIVLFSGLSCQVNALYSFLGKTDTSNLFTIDTICGGISTMKPMMELSKSGNYIGIHSFRNKDNGWKSNGYKYCLKLYDKKKNIALDDKENLVIKTFCSPLFKRDSCMDCKFTGFNRIADCTIGDFWGTDKYQDEHYNGLSSFIIHNERILNLLSQSDIVYYKIDWDEITKRNKNIFWTSYPQLRCLPSRLLAKFAIKHFKKPLISRLTRYDSWLNVDMRLYLRKVETLKQEFYKKNRP